MMLGRFSHVLQNAVDAIAPPTPLHDDFIYHWRRLMKHYLDVSTNKVPVELTNIPAHLQQLQRILQKEDDENKGEKMGPCVEYLLQHNMLDLLATLAATDDPPGMKQYVLQFVTRLITQLRIPVLAHCSVFPSLQRLVKTCDGGQHMPTENDEVHFLFILSALLRKQPQLIHMLDSQGPPGTPFDRRSSVSSEASSHVSVGSVFQSPLTLNGCDNQQQQDSDCQTPPPNNPLFRPFVLSPRPKEPKLMPALKSKNSQSTSSFDDNCDVFEDGDSGRISETDEEKIANSEYVILDALLSYIDSAPPMHVSPLRRLIRRTASNYCIILAADPNGVQDSRVRVKACQGIMLLVSLPDNKLANCLLENSQLCLTVVSKLCSLYADIPAINDPNQIDVLHVSWGLDVPVSIEHSSSESYRAISAFFSWFDFCDQLIKEAENGIGCELASSVHTLFFQELFPVDEIANVFVLSLITKCFKMASSPALLKEMSYWAVGESREADLPHVITCPVRQALIDCCCHENSAVSLEALRLFEVLLEKNYDHIIHCLVLAYVNRRAYFDSAASVSQIASWSDEEDERERCRESPVAGSRDNSSPLVTSRTFTPTHIEKIIHSFLNVVPPQLRSAPPTETSGYHQYVSESAHQYSKVLHACKSFSWPIDAVSDENGSSDSKPEADGQKIFYEGPFLKMLFNRLRNLPNQAYEINLELTAVVSRLSLLPHPFLHEYLLNPVLPHITETDSLYVALNDVASKLLAEVTALPDYKNRLSNTRHHLLGDVSDEQDEVSGILESVVVLEELCKELAAIAYVKFHNAL